MMKNLQLAALGALAAIGLASAATAQQAPARDKPGQAAKRSQNGMMGHGMMNDPQMRKQMTEMMDRCGKMMKNMDGMQMGAKAKS